MDSSPVFIDKSIVLRHVPLFSGLNFFEKKIVLESVEIQEFKKGQIIYRQGDPPDAFYAILSGRVEIFVTDQSREESLECLYRGKYFGFISLLTGESHSVSARALNDTLIARIPHDHFNAILKSIPRLAIDLSRMLSRRLKRKDLHPKEIFESTIIAIFGEESVAAQASLYALNLSVGLRDQTKKKVVMVDVAGPEPHQGVSVMPPGGEIFFMDKGLATLDEASQKITRYAGGVDILRISAPGHGPLDASIVTSLLTLLVNDYHYVLILLSSRLGDGVFKVLAQTDTVHLILEPRPDAFKRMMQLLVDSGVWSDQELKKKIKPIILETPHAHGHGVRLAWALEGALFHQPVYATLPPLENMPQPLIDTSYKDLYAKAIRRIARQIGEVQVGLALGSGSAMGISHIGVLKILEKENIAIDTVAGSSIGALVGALWCTGRSAEEVEAIILKNRNRNYVFGIDDVAFPWRGLLRGKHVRRFLEKYLGDMTFSDLRRSFKIVAVDAVAMRPVVFDSGRLLDAVMASIAIPGVFAPYRIGPRSYLDGGILDPLPTNILVEAGAKKIIAVNVLPSAEEIERTYELLSRRIKNAPVGRAWPMRALLSLRSRWHDLLTPNIFDVIVSSVQVMEHQLALSSSLSQADVTLHPDVSAVSWSDFSHLDDLIRRGEEETYFHLAQIKELLRRLE